MCCRGKHTARIAIAITPMSRPPERIRLTEATQAAVVAEAEVVAESEEGPEVLKLAKPLRPLRPRYPECARQRGIIGEVRLSFQIDAQGRAGEIEILSAVPAGYFEESATAALHRARFTPGDGISRHAITISYQLTEGGRD